MRRGERDRATAPATSARWTVCRRTAAKREELRWSQSTARSASRSLVRGAGSGVLGDAKLEQLFAKRDGHVRRAENYDLSGAQRRSGSGCDQAAHRRETLR